MRVSLQLHKVDILSLIQLGSAFSCSTNVLNLPGGFKVRFVVHGLREVGLVNMLDIVNLQKAQKYNLMIFC